MGFGRLILMEDEVVDLYTCSCDIVVVFAVQNEIYGEEDVDAEEEIEKDFDCHDRSIDPIRVILLRFLNPFGMTADKQTDS